MLSVAASAHHTSITQIFFDGNPFALPGAGAKLGQRGSLWRRLTRSRCCRSARSCRPSSPTLQISSL